MKTIYAICALTHHHLQDNDILGECARHLMNEFQFQFIGELLEEYVEEMDIILNSQSPRSTVPLDPPKSPHSDEET
jgi:hypothetical protein